MVLRLDSPIYDINQRMRNYSDFLSKQWVLNGCVDPEGLKRSILIVSNATGFVVARNIFATNNHVTGDKLSFLEVYSISEWQKELIPSSRKMTMIYTDVKDDISFIKVGAGALFLDAKPVIIAQDAPKAGDILMYIGHPKSEMYTVTFGRVDGYSSNTSDDGIHRTSLEVNGLSLGGNSGSPAFNCAGEVVGMHQAGNIGLVSLPRKVSSFFVTLPQLRSALQQEGIPFN